MNDDGLSAPFSEAMRHCRAMKDDGVSLDDRQMYLARVLRLIWPKARTEPWHHLCDDCNDTGWRLRVCAAGCRCTGVSTRIDDARQKPGGYKRLCVSNDEYTHEYVEPCHCGAGDKHLAKPTAQGEDFERVGQATSRRHPQRFGRW